MLVEENKGRIAQRLKGEEEILKMLKTQGMRQTHWWIYVKFKHILNKVSDSLTIG